MANWLVLGLGNPLSGADAFGPLVLERLREAAPIPGVSIADAGTDLLDWVSRFDDYDHVVLLDAVAVDDEDDAPAALPRVAVVGEKTFSQWDASSPGAHEMSPLVAVRLFRTLHDGATRPDIHLVALFAGEVEFMRCPLDAQIAAGVLAVGQLLDSPTFSADAATSGAAARSRPPARRRQ